MQQVLQQGNCRMKYLRIKVVFFKDQYKVISDLLHTIKQQGNELVSQKKYKNLQKPFRIFYNTQKHQTEDSECGMFSIYFIIKMLEGKSFHELNKQRITDNEVYKYRYVFFHPNDQTNTQELPNDLLDDKGDDDNDNDNGDDNDNQDDENFMNFVSDNNIK